MRFLIVVLGLLVAMASAVAQVSIGVAVPGVSIGFNVPAYPQLVRVPGYPVYYSPGMRSNYFFYDGMYWVFQNDNWYASSWYNGPWGLVGPEFVPLYVLRVPVRYYRNPPSYFRGWQTAAPPRWGDHWGREWEQHRSGWDQWDRRAAPAPAPLPVYQRQYSGNRYPAMAQQPVVRAQNYRYEPRDAIAKQHFQEQSVRAAPAPAPAARAREQSQAPMGRPTLQAAPPAMQQAPVQHPPPQAARPERQAPNAAPREPAQGRAPAREAPPRGKEQEKERDKGDERGQDHKR